MSEVQSTRHWKDPSSLLAGPTVADSAVPLCKKGSRQRSCRDGEPPSKTATQRTRCALMLMYRVCGAMEAATRSRESAKQRLRQR